MNEEKAEAKSNQEFPVTFYTLEIIFSFYYPYAFYIHLK